MSWGWHYLPIEIIFISLLSEVVFEKAYCEYRLNRVESALKTIEGAAEQTDKLKELYGQVVSVFGYKEMYIIAACINIQFVHKNMCMTDMSS